MERSHLSALVPAKQSPFPQAWMDEWQIVSIDSLPVPGAPMMLVTHLVAGIKFQFLAKIPKPDGFDALATAPEREAAIVASAMAQAEKGVDQRRCGLVGTFI
jgi:hypothetical protein